MQFELTGQRQHRGHFLDRIDVARLQETGDHLDVGIGDGRLAVLGVDQAVQALGHVLQVRVDQFDPVDLGHDPRALAHGADADGAVLANLDLLLWRHGNRPAIAHHRHTVAGPQHTQTVNVQAGGAHIGFTAIRGLHGDEAVAADGDVQVTAGFLHRARAEISGRALGHGIGPRRKAVTEYRHRARLLQVTLKTVGGNVRQVVGMGLLRQRVLAGAGHGHVKHLVHSISSARTCRAVTEQG
ncbi:hypothetical protein D3C80_1339140 [compost metagenome]